MNRQEKVIHFLRGLREEIIEAFEEIENGKKFEKTPWPYKKGNGGGEIGLLRGEVFEKAAVNFSAVEGSSFPMKDESGPFFATGVSLITHMKNPHMPTVHMNVRYIETKKRWWFGGGYDLTPMGKPVEEETAHFHSVAKAALSEINEEFYETFSAAAKEYFFIPHREKERGVGGIFFDHHCSNDFAKDFHLMQVTGKSFLPAILPIYQKKKNLSFSDKDKLIQLKERAHYAEFNLVYDRGTKFGFLSGGNPEAILCSMPPFASW